MPGGSSPDHRQIVLTRFHLDQLLSVLSTLIERPFQKLPRPRRRPPSACGKSSSLIARSSKSEHDEEIARFDVRTRCYCKTFDGAGGRGADDGLHLHRLDRPELLPGAKLLALADRERHHAGHRRGHVAVVARIRLLAHWNLWFERAVLGVDRSGLPVQRHHERPYAAFVRFGHGFEPDVQPNSGFEVQRQLLAGLQPVQERRGRDDRYVAVTLLGRRLLLGWSG